MKQKPMIFKTAILISNTERTKSSYDRIMEHAHKLTNDPDRHKRIERAECKYCFYNSRIGGQAYTSRECSCCGKEQTFSSTNTDVLCLECAKEHDLCKHCGGDINMRVRRKKWPVT